MLIKYSTHWEFIWLGEFKIEDSDKMEFMDSDIELFNTLEPFES